MAPAKRKAALKPANSPTKKPAASAASTSAKKKKVEEKGDDDGVDLSDFKNTKHKMVKVFKRRACEQIAVLSSCTPWIKAPAKKKDPVVLDSELNPGGEKPKRGSFEITVEREDGEKVLVWSGLKRGPPRREKFPDRDVLLKEVYNKLK